MGLIIKEVPKLMVGYPTVSDKYNITGGILAGTSDPVKFGDLVMFAGNGYFKKVVSASNIKDIAGFVLATNVKLAKGFADNEVEVLPHEAFNLVLPGSYLAVETALDAADIGDILPNGQVYVDLDDGALYADDGSGSYTALPNVVFTGVTELHGTKVCAEILVK